MVVGFERLVKTVRSRAWLGLYIIITEAGRASGHALEGPERLLSVILV